MDQQHLARIRLLSSRFLALQGLRVASAGATLAIVFASYVTVATPTRSGAMMAIFAAFVLMIPSQWWVHRYYVTTFGRQVPKKRNPWLILALFPLQLILFAFTMYLNRRFPEIPAGAPTTSLVTVIALSVAIRDWPWRAYYLIAPVAVAFAWSTTAFSDGPFDAGLTLSITFIVTGLSMVAIGLLDHFLLVRLTREARVPQAARAANPAGATDRER